MFGGGGFLGGPCRPVQLFTREPGLFDVDCNRFSIPIRLVYCCPFVGKRYHTFAPGAVLILSFVSAEFGMQRYLEGNQTTHFRPSDLTLDV